MPEPQDAGQSHRPGAGGRTRRPRGSLGPEAILDAAEALAAAGGFEAVTMRAVAARLRAAPMALYNHFPTKEGLVDALLDRVLGRFAPPPASEDWAEDLRAFASAHRRVLVEHPWAVAPLVRSPSPGLAAVRIGEQALAVLARGGITGTEAVAAFSGVIALNYGWSSFTAARALDGGAAARRVGEGLAALRADAFPLTAGVAGALAAYGSDEHYERVLGALVAGLSAPGRSEAGPRARARSRGGARA